MPARPLRRALRRLSTFLPLVCGLLIVGVGEPADASDDQPPVAPRGDRLPDGAVARLGAAQLGAGGYQVVLTPDGRRLIGANESLNVRVWDAITGALIETRQLPGPPHPGRPYGQVYLSPDGTRLVSVQPQSLEIWDVAAGARLRSVPRLAPLVTGRGGAVRGGPVQPAPVYGGSFAPDGQSFAAGEQADIAKFVISLYDLQTGSRRSVTQQTGTVSDPIFSPDGKRIAAMTFKARRLHVWSVASGNELWHTDETSDRPTWSKDGRWLAVYEVRNGGKLRDAETGREASFPTPPARGGYRFGPDSHTLLYVADNELVFWDVTTRQTTRTLRGVGMPFAFAPDGRSFYSLNPRDPVLQRWETATGKPLFPDGRGDGHLTGVRALAVSPDGKLAASLAPRESARLWDLATGRLLHAFLGDDGSDLAFSPDTGIVFTPDNRGLLIQTGSQQVRRYDVKDYKELCLYAATGWVHEFRPTADGTRLIGSQSEGMSGRWLMWDLQTGWLKESNLGARPTPLGAIAPDGSVIVEGDGAVIDVPTGLPRATLTTADQLEPWFAISADGKLAAAAVLDPGGDRDGPNRKPRGVQVWGLATGKPLAHIACGDIDRTRPAFSPDGRTLATCEADGFRLWNVATGRQVHYQPAHERQHGISRAFADTMVFAPDGRRLLTGHADGSILVWDVSAAGQR
jgi:WD40 repeat protein